MSVNTLQFLYSQIPTKESPVIILQLDNTLQIILMRNQQAFIERKGPFGHFRNDNLHPTERHSGRLLELFAR